jgi:hypothetical protein
VNAISLRRGSTLRLLRSLIQYSFQQDEQKIK